jgi:hypothetical protein
MPLYMTLQHLLNVLIQIANKAGLLKKNGVVVIPQSFSAAMALPGEKAETMQTRHDS